MQEQKSETITMFQAGAILLGMLTQTEDTMKFFSILGAAVVLFVLGTIQRTYMKKLMLEKGKDGSSNG